MAIHWSFPPRILARNDINSDLTEEVKIVVVKHQDFKEELASEVMGGRVESNRWNDYLTAVFEVNGTLVEKISS